MHPAAVLAAADQPGGAELLHMVGKGGLGDVHLLKNLARADIVLVLDGLVDAQARGVAQRLERRREALVVC